MTDKSERRRRQCQKLPESAFNCNFAEYRTYCVCSMGYMIMNEAYCSRSITPLSYFSSFTIRKSQVAYIGIDS
jgi:hypothetical protein